MRTAGARVTRSCGTTAAPSAGDLVHDVAYRRVMHRTSFAPAVPV